MITPPAVSVFDPEFDIVSRAPADWLAPVAVQVLPAVVVVLQLVIALPAVQVAEVLDPVTGNRLHVIAEFT